MAYCILYTAISEVEEDEKTGHTETFWSEPTFYERSEASLAATQEAAAYLNHTAETQTFGDEDDEFERDPSVEPNEEYFVAGPCGTCKETCPGRKDRVAA